MWNTPVCLLSVWQMKDYGVTEVHDHVLWKAEWLRVETSVFHLEGFVSLPGIPGSWDTKLLVGP